MYQNFVKVIDMVNIIIGQYEQPDMGDLLLLPTKGNVAFGTGKDCWGFSLTRFATMIADKFKVDKSKMMEKLWGDNYFNPESKKFTTDDTTASGKVL